MMKITMTTRMMTRKHIRLMTTMSDKLDGKINDKEDILLIFLKPTPNNLLPSYLILTKMTKSTKEPIETTTDTATTSTTIPFVK